MSLDLIARGSGKKAARRAARAALFSGSWRALQEDLLVKKSLWLGHQASPDHGSGTECCGTDVNANKLVFDPACKSTSGHNP